MDRTAISNSDNNQAINSILYSATDSELVLILLAKLPKVCNVIWPEMVSIELSTVCCT